MIWFSYFGIMGICFYTVYTINSEQYFMDFTSITWIFISLCCILLLSLLLYFKSDKTKAEGFYTENREVPNELNTVLKKKLEYKEYRIKLLESEKDCLKKLVAVQANNIRLRQLLGNAIAYGNISSQDQQDSDAGDKDMMDDLYEE